MLKWAQGGRILPLECWPCMARQWEAPVAGQQAAAGVNAPAGVKMEVAQHVVHTLLALQKTLKPQRHRRGQSARNARRSVQCC